MPSPDASEGREPAADDLTPSHLLIARACDSDPDGRSAEARVGFVAEPTESDLAYYREAIVSAFREGMGAEPERVAVAVLPWANDLDDDQETNRV